MRTLPGPDADRVASTLAGIRQRNDWASDRYAEVSELRESLADVPLLLAAVDTALKDHRKSTFPAGPPGAGDAYGKHYCAGICYTSIDDQVIYRVWPCQPYQDITTALAGKEAHDGG